jgi:GNAT superfamily N-acetyltransferase
MDSPGVVSVGCLNWSEVYEFLKRVYGENKSEFLHYSGSWLYRGNQHSLAVIVEGEIVAYCGVMPTKVLVNGVVRSGLWWVNLIVAPEFRRRGYETLLDKTVRKMKDVSLGFPNELASDIHRKHGWGIRNDVRMFFLPLRPSAVTGRSGSRSAMLRLAALIMSPFAVIARQRLGHYRPTTARKVKELDTAILAEVFFRYSDYYKRNQIVTTYRDSEFIDWRYASCPYRSQLEFYMAGQAESPSLVLIARVVDSPTSKEVRILDIFGDLGDKSGLRDILRLVIRDAVCRGASRVITMSSLPALYSLLRSIGFLYSMKEIFCWHSQSVDLMRTLGKSTCHWTLADSDMEHTLQIR